MIQNYIDIGKNIIETEICALENIKKSIDKNFIEIANEIYLNTGKLVITGIGKSGIIGKKIAATLSSTGTNTIFVNSTEALHGDLGMICSKDIVLGISNSGEGNELLSIVPAIKNIGAKFFSITGNINSSLAKISDKHILCPIQKEGCPLNLAPMASTTAELALGDALAGILMTIRNFQANDFAKYHPGGSLGRKLLSKIKDLMISGEKLAICAPETNIENVIIELNSKRLGIICVLDNKKLVGIITEGDIRRALIDKNTFFSKLAKDIMTINYKKIDQNLLATEALAIMEKEEYQISVAPVFNNDKFVGIIRIHDLLKI